MLNLFVSIFRFALNCLYLEYIAVINVTMYPHVMCFKSFLLLP